jgi:hypothetical protein
MVDRESRSRFAESIRALVAGRITNDELEDSRLPELEADDPAISEIYKEGVWHLYSDLHEHHLRGKYAISRQDKATVARWVLFLRTDLPYEWPVLRGWRFFGLALANLISVGLANRFYSRWFAQQGKADIWPFIRPHDLAFAQRNCGYLGAASNNSFKPSPLRGLGAVS